jgi:DNA-binding PadR family transcriptional regulator
MENAVETADYSGRLVRRGDMGLVLLGALLTRPMHGYELIRTLEEKSKGTWRPSPGSVYPTLQLLEEQEFVTSSQQHGKKVYTITQLGRDETAKRKPQAPTECGDLDLEKIAALRAATVELMELIKVITFKGSEADYHKAEQAITAASKKLSALIHAKKEEK